MHVERWALAPLVAAIGVAVSVGTAGVPSQHQDRAIRVAGDAATTSASLPTTRTTSATTLPTATSTTALRVTSAVKAGDTLGRIAVQFGVSVSDIVAGNKISDPNVMSAGEVLVIPPSRAATTTTAVAPASTASTPGATVQTPPASTGP